MCFGSRSTAFDLPPPLYPPRHTKNVLQLLSSKLTQDGSNPPCGGSRYIQNMHHTGLNWIFVPHYLLGCILATIAENYISQASVTRGLLNPLFCHAVLHSLAGNSGFFSQENARLLVKHSIKISPAPAYVSPIHWQAPRRACQPETVSFSLPGKNTLLVSHTSS